MMPLDQRLAEIDPTWTATILTALPSAFVLALRWARYLPLADVLTLTGDQLELVRDLGDDYQMIFAKNATEVDTDEPMAIVPTRLVHATISQARTIYPQTIEWALRYPLGRPWLPFRLTPDDPPTVRAIMDALGTAIG